MKTIIVLGTWSSGSGAVSDYLTSRREIINPYGVNEFKIVSDPRGLNYLYNNCYFKKDLLLSSHVFQEFKKYISKVQQYQVYTSKGKKKIIYKKNINILADKFLKEITYFKYYGLPHFKSSNLEFKEKILLKFKRKFTKKSIPELKILPIITPVEKKIFVKKAKKFILNIIKSSTNKKIKDRMLLLNNGADICDPVNSTKYYHNPKIICVTRDPRDIYCGMKMRQAGSTPWYDVKLFVKWYKFYFGNKNFQKILRNKSILHVKFENFVNSFEKENKRICKFLGIKEKQKISKQNIFDLNFSKKNVYKSKRYIKKSEFLYIKNSLKNYLQW